MLWFDGSGQGFQYSCTLTSHRIYQFWKGFREGHHLVCSLWVGGKPKWWRHHRGGTFFFHFVDVPSVFMIIGRLGGGIWGLIWGHRSWQGEPGDQHLISPIFHSRKPTRYYYRGCGVHGRFGWRFSWLEVRTNLTNFSYSATRTRESKQVEVERT